MRGSEDPANDVGCLSDTDRENAVSIEADIIAISAARDAALVANDASAIASAMTDDWIYVGPTGTTTKADIVGSIATGRLAHHTMDTVGPVRVAVHGDTAIVTAHRASTGSWDGVAYTEDEWMTDVYVRQGGRWLCALSHKSPTER
jgi:uncharacterized protein (TIGR02246 family)